MGQHSSFFVNSMLDVLHCFTSVLTLLLGWQEGHLSCKKLCLFFTNGSFPDQVEKNWGNWQTSFACKTARCCWWNETAIMNENEWKCEDFKCVWKPTESRLCLTHYVNKSSRWAKNVINVIRMSVVCYLSNYNWYCCRVWLFDISFLIHFSSLVTVIPSLIHLILHLLITTSSRRWLKHQVSRCGLNFWAWTWISIWPWIVMWSVW